MTRLATAGRSPPRRQPKNALHYGEGFARPDRPGRHRDRPAERDLDLELHERPRPDGLTQEGAAVPLGLVGGFQWSRPGDGAIQRRGRPGVGQRSQGSGSVTSHNHGPYAQGLERRGSLRSSSSSRWQSVRVIEPRMALVDCARGSARVPRGRCTSHLVRRGLRPSRRHRGFRVRMMRESRSARGRGAPTFGSRPSSRRRGGPTPRAAER